MEFTLTHPDSGPASILILFDGVLYEATSDHPWWNDGRSDLVSSYRIADYE